MHPPASEPRTTTASGLPSASSNCAPTLMASTMILEASFSLEMAENFPRSAAATTTTSRLGMRLASRNLSTPPMEQRTRTPKAKPSFEMLFMPSMAAFSSMSSVSKTGSAPALARALKYPRSKAPVGLYASAGSLDPKTRLIIIIVTPEYSLPLCSLVWFQGVRVFHLLQET